MKPDTTYPLHSDDDQQAAPSPRVDDAQQTQPNPPSAFDQPQPPRLEQDSTVPWYLRPLTKTTESPVTSTQTRPYIPRQPLPPQPQASDTAKRPELVEQPPQIIQAPPLSPFRSPSQPNSTLPPPASQYQAPPRPPLQSPYQRPTPAAMPTPLSQFGISAPPQQGGDNAQPSTQPKTSKKKRPLILIGLALLLVVGLIAGMYALYRYTTSTQPATTPPATRISDEDRFYDAIENHLSTNNIHQVYDQMTTGVDTSTINIDATSNFTDPVNPKSDLTYELQSGKDDAAISGAGKIIALSQAEYYGKLTKPVLFYQGPDAGKPKESQWYQLQSTDVAGEMLLDPLSARASINTSLGEIPVGNFTKETRQELMRFIKDRKVYTIKTSKEVDADNQKMTQYSVTVDIEALNALNAKIVELLGGNPDDNVITFTKSDTQTTNIWVNNDTSSIVRVQIEREFRIADQDRLIKEKTNLVIDYPDSVDINAPTNAVAGTWPKQ